jgi:hypothetical protein
MWRQLLLFICEFGICLIVLCYENVYKIQDNMLYWYHCINMTIMLLNLISDMSAWQSIQVYIVQLNQVVSMACPHPQGVTYVTFHTLCDLHIHDKEIPSSSKKIEKKSRAITDDFYCCS